ncbi:hypothetical protein SAMN02927921_03784 [Sinomicrobium oceani]|uniref:Uncharacterized protein n=1 Tax=Sinomicrobium oceani TaxID=1150368 RepID=A0A1K1RMF7_9FLAO|nr:hypothetical protein SAMN02927921_03784 [Sinomicrobium oceani]
MITFLSVLFSLLIINVLLLTFSINKTEKKTKKPFRFYPEKAGKNFSPQFDIKNYREAV